VASLPSATGRGYLTLAVTPQAGCPAPALSEVQAVMPSAFGGDPGFAYPFGMVQFMLNCPGPVDVTIYVHDGTQLAQPPNTYRKYGHMAPNFAGPRIFYSLPATSPTNLTVGTATIGGNLVLTVRFTLQDTQLGDDGPPNDNAISDPGGIATMGSAVPTVSVWGLSCLAALLSVVAWLAVRRDSRRTARRR